jgi:hypothetical protein
VEDFKAEEGQMVFGILYEPNVANGENEGSHSHEIFLVTWDGRMLHTHGFSGVTSLDVGHRHSYVGTTRPAPSGVPHTHEYSTITTLNDGHRHRIAGRTGPAIPLTGGGHFHYFTGITTIDGSTPHSHSYSGRTGNERPE